MRGEDKSWRDAAPRSRIRPPGPLDPDAGLPEDFILITDPAAHAKVDRAKPADIVKALRTWMRAGPKGPSRR